MPYTTIPQIIVIIFYNIFCLHECLLAYVLHTQHDLHTRFVHTFFTHKMSCTHLAHVTWLVHMSCTYNVSCTHDMSCTHTHITLNTHHVLHTQQVFHTHLFCTYTMCTHLAHTAYFSYKLVMSCTCLSHICFTHTPCLSCLFYFQFFSLCILYKT